MAIDGFAKVWDPIHNELSVFADTVSESITEHIDSELGRAVLLFAETQRIVQEWISSETATYQDPTEAYTSRVYEYLGTILNPAIETLESIESNLTLDIGDNFQTTAATLDRIELDYLTPVKEAISDTWDFLLTIDDKVKEAIGPELQAVKAVTTDLVERVSGSALNMLEGLKSMGSELGGALNLGLEGLSAGIEGAASKVIGGFFESVSADLATRVDGLITTIEEEPNLPESIKALTAPGALVHNTVGGWLSAIGSAMAVATSIVVAMQPWQQKIKQRVSAEALESLLAPAELAGALDRGWIEGDKAIDQSARQGYTTQDFELIRYMIRLRPQTVELIDYWRRELISDGQLNIELKDLGWTDSYVKLIKEAAYPPPGVQDLITMAVREVFTPEVAESFGQFQDVPQAYLEWSSKIGLSREWALNYWAAHWQLPSPYQTLMLTRSLSLRVRLSRL